MCDALLQGSRFWTGQRKDIERLTFFSSASHPSNPSLSKPRHPWHQEQISQQNSIVKGTFARPIWEKDAHTACLCS